MFSNVRAVYDKLVVLGTSNPLPSDAEVTTPPKVEGDEKVGVETALKPPEVAGVAAAEAGWVASPNLKPPAEIV